MFGTLAPNLLKFFVSIDLRDDCMDSRVDSMNQIERRAMSGLSLVFAFRMLGMFMVLPVLATYGPELASTSGLPVPLLIGIAIGAYGLTQALLQIPFGMLSDRVGRMPVIYAGLLVFALGSGVAAMAESIEMLIAGRIIQGAGAISAAVMALLSDLTREQHRTKVMAGIGMSIGLSFVVAMIAGPVITRWVGLSGLFWFTSLMALFGIFLMAVWVPKPQKQMRHLDSGINRSALRRVFADSQLLRLDVGIFVLHALLMASFTVLPLVLVEQGGLPREEHWWVYVIAMVTGFVAMVPFIIYSEKQRQLKKVFLGAIALVGLSQLYFWLLGFNLVMLVIGAVLFFAAFNLLEATLPSLISKIAPAGAKGTAMGIYSTSQFLGAAVGGFLGGGLYTLGGNGAVFAGCAALAALWWFFAATMQEPPYVTSTRLTVAGDSSPDEELLERLRDQPGVMDALYVAEEAAVYVRFDNKLNEREQLQAMLGS